MRRIDTDDIFIILAIVFIVGALTNCQQITSKEKCVVVTGDFERCSKEFGGFP